MNKNLFLKLGLGLLLSVSLIACGQKNSVSESSTNQFVNKTQSSIKEDTQSDAKQDTQSDAKQNPTEDEYYIIIKEAWQKQKDYIDSIDDPKVKQSVQTTNSAAIMKSTELLMKYPEDSDTINAALNRVLNGE